MSQDDAEELKTTLDVLLNKKNLYLNDTLNLSTIADEMGISNKKLSELLNQQLNTSFYNLINGSRIVEVKRRMSRAENDKLT